MRPPPATRPLSLRDVEDLMLARGVVVTYETIRSWCAKFGPDYAAQLRRRRPRPGDKWHLDEVFVKINGTTHYLWRAVDQHGDVLDILVQSRRNAVAAKRFFRKLLKGLRYVPRVLVTDKLASYQVAHREVLPSVGTVTLVEKWSGTVEFGAAAMKHRLVVHLSGNDGRGDFPPDREAVSHLGTPFGCGQSVPPRPKMR